MNQQMHTRNLYFSIGRPFAPFYSLIMRLREKFYSGGVFKVHSMGVPVISVGNLTLGGTGKTPLVLYICRLLRNNGYSPAVISRGYGGAAKGKVNIVSDGRRILLGAKEAGDETRLLAESLPGVPVLTGKVRIHPASRALELGADVLVLDDGFQHMRIERHVNLVLFNSESLAGNSRVFPGGDLREPVAALNRATDFVMTGVCESNRERAERFLDLLDSKVPGKGKYLASYKPCRYVQLDDEGRLSATDALVDRDVKVFGFCGIARPESFAETIESLNVHSVGFKSYGDHAAYSRTMVEKLQARAVEAGAEILLTTEKDLVKFVGVTLDLPLYGVGMEVSVDKDFDAMLLEAVEKRNV